MLNSNQNSIVILHYYIILYSKSYLSYKKKKKKDYESLNSRYDIYLHVWLKQKRLFVLGSPTFLPPTLESCSCAYMGWHDLCDWRHSFPRTKLLPKAGVRFIRYIRGETGPLDGAWRRDASHTLTTKLPPTSFHPRRVFPFYRSFSSPIFSLPPSLWLFSYTNNSVRDSFLCILSSILFSLPFKPPNISSLYSVSFPFPSLRLLLSSSSQSLPGRASSDNYISPPLPLFFSPRTIRFHLPLCQLLSLRANSLRAISCI